MSDQASNDGSRGRRDGERFPGAKVLVARSPRVVLERLLAGDPLALRRRTRGVLERERWFLPPACVLFRSAARVAYDAMSYRGRPALDVWLAGRIERAIADALVDQREEERMQLPAEDAEDGAFHAAIARRLGVEETLGRLACTILNGLPLEVRRAVHATVVERKSINRWVAEGHGPPARVRRHLRRARRAIHEAVKAKRDEELGS